MESPSGFSEIKQYAFKTLECFDNLAKPEIKNRIMVKVWEYVRNYTFKIILRKPDKELRLKLFQVYQVLGPLFKDTELSLEIQKSESLGSVKVPDVGELGKVRKLTVTSDKETLEILKELKL